MIIDEKLLNHIADLAKLEFPEGEKEHIKSDLNRILEFINQMKAVDTDNVEPLVYMSDAQDILREDDVRQDISQAEALKNAPEKDSDYFKVPKVIKK